MTYSTSSHIRTIEDVQAFFRHLREERHMSIGPDEMFESHVSCQGGIHMMSLSECPLYNRLMDECIEVCRREGVKIEEMR